MNAQLGTAKSVELKKNRDGKSNVRIANCEITDPEDVQSVEVQTPSGEDFVPENNDVYIVLSISEAYKIGLLSDDKIAPDASLEAGEKEIYSRLDGAKLAKIKLNKDSEIVLNDGTDFAVAFEKLQAKIDALNTLLVSHVHTGVASGGSSTGTSGIPEFINIDDSKVEKVRL